jgi:hypothetical protein
MFRTATIGIFIAVAIAVAADLTWRVVSHRLQREESSRGRFYSVLGLIRFCVYAAALVSLAAVAVTGFLPVIAGRAALSGYMLMAHVTVAGGFAVAAMMVAVLGVAHCGDEPSGWNRDARKKAAASVKIQAILRKSFFWTALAFAIPTLGTALVAMFPLASPAQQQVLLEIHRICALALTVSGVFFAYYSAVEGAECSKD